MPKNNPTARQLEIWAERKKHSSVSATARALGVTHQTVFTALKRCEMNGLSSEADPTTRHTPIGNKLGKVTQQIDYRSDPAGKVVQEWQRSSPGITTAQELTDFLSRRTPAEQTAISRPDKKEVDREMLLQIDLADVHFGQLSWGEETHGDDYDIDITRNLITGAMTSIYSRTGPVSDSLLVLYGDNFHSDFFSGLTEKNKNPLDLAGRYSKIIKAGTETFCTAIEIAAKNSNKVEVIVLYGNHDKQSSFLLQLILDSYFRHSRDRIHINMDPGKTRYFVWGITAQNFHHGDGTKPERLAADILRYVAENDITGVRDFRSNQAHLHKETRQDINGVVYECKPSLVATDAYGAGAVYNSRRAAIATSFHKNYGELSRYTITPRALKAMLNS